jgi:quinol monooxygenase YgiN
MFTAILLASALTAVDVPRCCANVELRQYTVVAGKRDAFIPLFEGEFIETQEALGMRVIGQFRDLDDPNHFVWLRGFTDMPSRAKQLQEFYFGPVWKAHREEANAFFTDTDNVLLLRAPSSEAEFDLSHSKRAALSATENTKGVVIATIYYFDAPVTTNFVHAFEATLAPALKKSGVHPLAYFVSETEPNNFPRLPVRENDHVFVWLALYADIADYEKHRDAFMASRAGHDAVAQIEHRLAKPPQILRLTPTSRSLLHD